MSVQMKIKIHRRQVRHIEDIAWHSGMNVQQAMEIAYGGKGYGFVLQYFGTALGYEAIAIDNIFSQNGTDEYLFWELSIDDVVSQEGIDETDVSDGASIDWNYTRYVEEEHGNTRRAAIRQQFKMHK